jgi:hypothetical protein
MHLFLFCSLDMIPTEGRCRLVKIPASYSGEPGFKSRPADRLSWLVFRGFPEILQANAGIVPLSYTTASSFQFDSNSSFTYRCFIRRYIITVTGKASLNKLQIYAYDSNVYD